jgi:hypothetical protein
MNNDHPVADPHLVKAWMAINEWDLEVNLAPFRVTSPPTDITIYGATAASIWS